MSDKGHELTDKKLAELEKKLKGLYKQASDEVEKKLDDYLKAFKAKDARHLADLQKDFTKENYEEYIRWRQGQVLISERWEEMRQSLAEDYHNANVTAKSIINGYMPDIYALNHNYGTYDVEHKGLVDTSYTLYDRQTAERLMRDDPDMLPPPGRKVSKRIAEGKDILWNKGQIQSAMWQSVTQGESMDKIAKRLARTVGEKDMAAAIRNARTMTTGAECAGRVDSYKRAESMGVDMQQEWMSTLDNRTRHSHRAMHGERIPVDGTFSNGCRFPGDPNGEPEEVYNCRCTLVSAIKGFEGDKVTYSPKLGDMSFEEWVGEHEKGLDKTGKSGIIYSIGGKSDNIYEPYNYEPKVTKDVRKVFNDEYKMAEERFGKISTVKGVHVLNDKSSDEGTYNDNSGHIELRHAEKKNGLQVMARIALEKYKSGEWSSSNPHHVIRHEIGHAIQAEHKSNDPLWNDKLSKISDVFDKIISEEPGYKAPSSYAMNDINEYISECIAASYKKSSGKVVNVIIDIINGGV